MQTAGTAYGLVWSTTYLRVVDNGIPYTARQNHERLIDAYCLDPRHFSATRHGFKKTGRYRARFLLESVEHLRQGLARHNIPLYAGFEEPESLIPAVVSRHAIVAVYHQAEWTHEEADAIQAARARLPAGVTVHAGRDQFLFDPENIGLDARHAPELFTSYKRQVQKRAFNPGRQADLYDPGRNFQRLWLKDELF